jgi:hypothetical protein
MTARQDPHAALPVAHGATPPPPRPPVGEHEPRRHGCNEAPSGSARSRATPRSVLPAMPTTAAEAMARFQILLNFPPSPDKMDEWRTTIQSLINFADPGKTHDVGPSRRPPTMLAGPSGYLAGDAAQTVESPRHPHHLSGQPTDQTTMTCCLWLRQICGTAKISAKCSASGATKTPARRSSNAGKHVVNLTTVPDRW